MATGLFKYFPTNCDKLKWFADGQILLTPPQYFNDPWDFLVRFEQWTDEELKEQCPASLSYSAKDFKEFRDAMTSVDFHAEESRNFQDEIGKIVGVVSLAENPFDRVMWAHYAESHCGFVAEFAHGEEFLEDGFRQRVGPFGSAAKVQYLKPYEQHPKWIRDSSNIEKDAKVLWTKHLKWDYEQEWRVVQSRDKATSSAASDGTPRSLLRFDPSHLLRVIFGLHICPTVEAKLREMLGCPKFKNVRKEKVGIDPITNELISSDLHQFS
jgi:hypothetical protein